VMRVPWRVTSSKVCRPSSRRRTVQFCWQFMASGFGVSSAWLLNARRDPAIGLEEFGSIARELRGYL
jgi:hypothetical protein